ncbi:hypothetical protein Cfor_11727 [Coptotermes formosanus]|uniref:Uncharacterized protein n=1 Tax=Coptotermes formosanus TaxID=36987 RepID=A0A6L2PV35_COPFO|nr:hypothetical protein Cfor_11727 [Coptotermes formosanus]
MWCWRKKEKISWTDRVRNEEVLLRVKEKRNILHKMKRREANWIGHIVRQVVQRVATTWIMGGRECGVLFTLPLKHLEIGYT